jgi:pimeloyl-ACP methyl ester carboxylesterase
MKRIPFLMTLGAGLAGAGERKPKELPVPGESFLLEGREAFLILPENRASGRTPWVWYAPTLPGLPGPEERWMFGQFLAAGIAVAGIDAGESYGSPDGCRIYDLLYAEMTGKRGMSAKPVMLGRSRGGLMTLSWAAGRPDCCGGFAGIYPVCDLSSYPGLVKACGAFGLSEAGLAEKLREHNPVDRLSGLAKAGVPFFAVHGDVDTLVPLEKNSGALAKRYRELGGSMELIVPKGQGHNMWEGFFRCAELVAFVKKHAKGVAP